MFVDSAGQLACDADSLGFSSLCRDMVATRFRTVCAISESGMISSAAPILIASLGMPKMTQLYC